MKIKVAPLPRPVLKPIPRPLARPAGAEPHPPVTFHTDDTRRWYEALGRLVGVTASEAFRQHYPGQAGEPTPATSAAFHRVRGRVTHLEILAELKRPVPD